MSCKFCTIQHDDDGNERELVGELCWGPRPGDAMSYGRLTLWHDEDGWMLTVLVDNTQRTSGDAPYRPVNRLPSVASFRPPVCPLCGRRLD